MSNEVPNWLGLVLKHPVFGTLKHVHESDHDWWFIKTIKPGPEGRTELDGETLYEVCAKFRERYNLKAY